MEDCVQAGRRTRMTTMVAQELSSCITGGLNQQKVSFKVGVLDQCYGAHRRHQWRYPGGSINVLGKEHYHNGLSTS